MICKILAIALLIGLVAAPALARDWTKIDARVRQSVIMTHQGPATCSAFSIDRKHGYFLTAAHCTTDGDFDMPPLSGIYASEIVFVDEEADIAVLHFPGLHLPALMPRNTDFRSGLEVRMIGHAYGWPAPIFKAANVASVELLIGGEPMVILDAPPIGGMSGGPVVDTDGSVIGLIDATDHVLTLAAGIHHVYELTRQYWEWKAKAEASEATPSGMQFLQSLQ